MQVYIHNKAYFRLFHNLRASELMYLRILALLWYLIIALQFKILFRRHHAANWIFVKNFWAVRKINAGLAVSPLNSYRRLDRRDASLVSATKMRSATVPRAAVVCLVEPSDRSDGTSTEITLMPRKPAVCKDMACWEFSSL